MLTQIKEKWGIEFYNAALLTAIVILNSIQILVVICFIFNQIPMASEIEQIKMITADGGESALPEREIFFYRIFVTLALLIGTLSFLSFRKKLGQINFSFHLEKLFLVDLISVTVVMAFLFNYVLIGLDWNLRYLLYCWIGISLFLKFLGTEVRQKFLRISELKVNHPENKKVTRFLDYSICIFIALSILIPDRSAALAEIFIQDQLWHLDGFVVAPVWAYVKGLIPNVTVNSFYGAGVPFIISHLTKVFGMLRYESIFSVILLMAAIYFIACYVFLRLWLKSILISLIGVIWLIKLQMFHCGAPNFPWLYMPNTVLRYFFFIFILIFLYRHLVSGHKKYLWAAGFFTGIGVFYVIDSGIYQLGLYYCYLSLLLVNFEDRRLIYRNKGDILRVLFYFLMPLIVSLLFFWMVVGKHVSTLDFWNNQLQLIRSFTGGLGLYPIKRTLDLGGRTAYFIIGYLIPLIYIFTILSVTMLRYKKKIGWTNGFAVLIGIYGLAIYHNFLGRSDYYHLFDVTGPLVLIVCYWLFKVLKKMKDSQKKFILIVIFFVSVFALWTTTIVLLYPSMVSLAQFDPALTAKGVALKEYLTARADISLIQRLSRPSERVCLISSFETALLMEADRKPFFYQFPLLYSSFWRGDFSGGTSLVTRQSFVKAMNQLDQGKPLYIFVEKRFFFRQIAPKFWIKYPALTALIDYLHKHYDIADEGQYLLALKRM